MRDLGIFLICASLSFLALFRPWLGLLGLTVFSYMQPHAYASGFMQHFPVIKVLFLSTLLGSVFTKDRALPSPSWQAGGLAALWLGFMLTTFLAIDESFGGGYVLPKFLEVSKTFLIVGLSLVLINSRYKLQSLVATISLSIALVTLKGGYWALTTGFADRVYGPPDSQYYDNNHFAVLVVMNIPLLVFLFKRAASRASSVVLGLSLALSVAAALSSWSRGALLSLGVTGFALVVQSRRKLRALVVSSIGAGLAFFALQQGWFARMETLVEIESEASAVGRINAWTAGFRYALERPFVGAGFESWRWDYVMDWHSAYVEILVEHGFIVFGLWVGLVLGIMLRLFRLALRAHDPLVVDLGYAISTSLLAYLVGAAFLGLAYWNILYQLIALSALIGLSSSRRPFSREEPS